MLMSLPLRYVSVRWLPLEGIAISGTYVIM